MQLMDNSAKLLWGGFSPNVKSLVLDIYTSTSYTAEVIFFYLATTSSHTSSLEMQFSPGLKSFYYKDK